MSRIYIIGIVASGKTTFAKALSAQLGIPHYELDTIVHVDTDAARYKRTPEEQIQVIEEIDKAGDWIIEGTYRASCHCLLDIADYIIFLNTPLWKRIFRIFFRFIKQQLRIEPCHYQSDLKMLRRMYKWTLDFERDRHRFTSMLYGYKEKLHVISKPSTLIINF